MILQKPPRISQAYGRNKNKLFYGAKGHSGVDYNVGYGKPIYALAGGTIHHFYKQGTDPRIHYWGVYYRVTDEQGKKFEVGHGHLSSIAVKIGDKVKVGDLIGYEGNGGNVASGGRKITKEERLNGSHAGSHCHMTVKAFDKNWKLLNADNGVGGRINPAQFYAVMSQYDRMLRALGIRRTIRKGSKGVQVKQAQIFLNIHGSKLSVDGMFGPITEVEVLRFQRKNNLVSDGIIGKRTWKALLS